MKELSDKLTEDFGKGFDERNLRYFRMFYLQFPIQNAVRSESTDTSQKLKRNAVRSKSAKALKGADTFQIPYALRRELSWTHYRLLLSVEAEAARTWYMNEAADSNWSTRALERQINTFTYQRILSSKNKKRRKKKSRPKSRKSVATGFY